MRSFGCDFFVMMKNERMIDEKNALVYYTTTLTATLDAWK